ncbi:MAG: hypothetical protein ABIS50_26695 [Luteolibacter sp.]|uniref:hypothetical protein n=1 Tax=Luteolibacter sp. TaxID=1962973 RepID=UPI003266C2BA
MKFTIFQSDKGDCLLLESSGGTRILADGGMLRAYGVHVAPHLGRMRKSKKELDLVYVSHIDEDHIAGILQMMDDEAAWRVFDFQSEQGNTHFPKPKNPRPAKAKAIWHNAFHEQTGENAGPIEDLLAASASVLSAAVDPDHLSTAQELGELALSQKQAILLSRRIGGNQLNIPLNEPAEGKLMYVRENLSPFALGDLNIYVIGPFEEDLDVLRKEWDKWLKDNKEVVRKIQERAAEDEANIGNDIQRLTDMLAAKAAELGNREKVTPPNLASLMFLIEEPSDTDTPKRYLMTGDGSWQDILKGLRHHEFITDASPGLHVDVLKAQHHGSENNFSEEFCKAITADHYVFCGNGEHENPDLRVIDLVVNSRIGTAAQRSSNPQTGKTFKMWFNSSSTSSIKPAAQSHMKKVEKKIQDAAATSNKVKFRFLDAPNFQFTV